MEAQKNVLFKLFSFIDVHACGDIKSDIDFKEKLCAFLTPTLIKLFNPELIKLLTSVVGGGSSIVFFKKLFSDTYTKAPSTQAIFM